MIYITSGRKEGRKKGRKKERKKEIIEFLFYALLIQQLWSERKRKERRRRVPMSGGRQLFACCNAWMDRWMDD